MKLSVFSAKQYDRRYFDAVHTRFSSRGFSIKITYHEYALDGSTASSVQDADAICAFVNDTLSGSVIATLACNGVMAILLRCAGYDHVDLEAATEHGLMVANVPSYSPESVAEFAVAMAQTLNRNTHRAYNRVREGNFAINGLLGQILCGKTVGLLGTGKIGLATARIMKGFGCQVLAYDPFPSADLLQYGEYKSLDEVLAKSDVISLHCPLMEATRYLVNEDTIMKMKEGVLLVNTSRGGLIDTTAVIKALKTKQIGGVALDVYGGEVSLFYDDRSGKIIHDDVLMRLISFHNVIVTGHQAFFTKEALYKIAECTLKNLEEFVAEERAETCLTSIWGQIQSPCSQGGH